MRKYLDFDFCKKEIKIKIGMVLMIHLISIALEYWKPGRIFSVKIIHIWSFSGTCFPAFCLNTESKSPYSVQMR